ncbi:MAG: FAD-dependent oxidoreductase [Bacteroidales bacterium]|jgi:glycine/D-amino acid oxidase-like deaminating enzyme/Fe-S-cluster-containing hydrogenase component 2/ferredoxin|nr:FAD-dependent oxidoreductase [Bacteroidales bacterium]
MGKIISHPILQIPDSEIVSFKFNGKEIQANKGFTIAAALHQAGIPVHSHSIENRNRSLACGIGKCGACEMLVDGKIKRICITKVDNVNEVTEISKNFIPKIEKNKEKSETKIYHTSVAIVGAGPAGLATRELLNKYDVANIVIDNNDKIGGQFIMQTHQFFFFEKEKKFGGMRGFDIAKTLAGDNYSGIMLNSIVWDIFDGKKICVKNIKTNEIFYVYADNLVVATGSIPFMPAFKNDDVPGVYTAAVVQKMMNNEFTLLGKNVLTIGAGNIGYLTSYQLMQAGAKVKAIIEAAPNEGGFPVQANRIRRLGIPILTNHILVEAIPNDDYSGIVGAVIAKCENFTSIKGTEKIITGIDAINICTGLVSDNQLSKKGALIFGRNTFTIGDAVRIGEGTSAVLRGKQAAFEILEEMGIRYNYDEFLQISKDYIDSQQHPIKIIDKAYEPERKRAEEKPYIKLECIYGFACNPCEFACPHSAITKIATNTIPKIDYEKCIGCMECISNCPGLAIFGYNEKKDCVFLPFEYFADEGSDVFLVNNNGEILGEGIIEKILLKPNKTNVARVKSLDIHGEKLAEIKGFIVKKNYPEKFVFEEYKKENEAESFICHCEDVRLEKILEIVGDRKFISIDEIKHNTRLGMGACRGNRCIKRLKLAIAPYGIEITGDQTPRAPLSNQVNIGDINQNKGEKICTNSKNLKRVKVQTLIAGGGMAGTALFREFAEAGLSPVLINDERGSSWRCIAGGRPAFSLPALAEIAIKNRDLFENLQKIKNIDYHKIRYVNLVHDEETFKSLDASRAWSNAFMIDKKDFRKEISPFFNLEQNVYSHALISHDCWQATPGKTIDLLRKIGISKGGQIFENCELIDVFKENSNFIALVKNHAGEYLEYETEHFVNALGPNAGIFANKLGYEIDLYPVKHQAFITRRLPMLGKDGTQLDMIIDRRKYKNFSAVYGQQLAETGQIIGCASPAIDGMETFKNLKTNSKEFIEIISEMFADWIPELSGVSFQTLWAGYYTEPRYIVDTEKGLFCGLRGHGFMLSMYLAKLYTEAFMGKQTPDYFKELKLNGKGLSESAFK